MKNGFTLVELLVVIALMTITTALVAATWAPSRKTGLPTGRLTVLRRRAVATGRAFTDTATYGSTTITIRALPDGRILGAGALGIAPLSGLPPR